MAFKKRSAKLCAVVKANAYGHGAEEVVFALADIADAFAVALVDEALSIRGAACGKDILVLTPPLNEEEGYAIAKNGFIASLPDLRTAKLLVYVCKKYRLTVRVHLKVNTGMNRYGMNANMLGRVCNFLRQNPCARVEGLYSHLYACDIQIAEAQRRSFLRMQAICKRYFSSFVSHLGATYGAALGEKFAFDMLRIGIGLYGYSPTKMPFPLHKGMTVETRVAYSRTYAQGGLGYGKEVGQKGEKLALCRMGYADGFLRDRKNGAAGWRENANELCMDACIRRSNQRRGGRVAVLTDADETARIAGTISYEVLCAATRRAEFVYDYND